jgi:uncharacterized protein YndB with AHSA1/START domain
MTNDSPAAPPAIRLERSYEATPQQIWDLWTTTSGIQSWWSPDGFVTEVRTLDLTPGGRLEYVMTATAAEQIEFMENAGMPLSTESTKTFTEVRPITRLAYVSRIDFVPGVEPYDHLTTVEIAPAGDGTAVVMTIDPLHDEVWTGRIRAGRENELDNLAKLVS